MNKEGKFIVFEGIDGSGKTTQSKMLVDYLNNNGEKSIWTKEQTGGLVGRLIEDVLTKKEVLDSMALQVCFVADRVDHLNSFVKPETEKGKIVISDRYYWSTAAYGYLSGSEKMELLLEINQKLCPEPDLFVLVDIEPKIAIERMNLGRGSLSIFEKQEKLEKIREAYLSLAERFKDKTVVIDGNKKIEEIHQDILKNLKNKKII